MDTKPNRSAELIEQLREGVADLTTSEGWAAHLAVQAKFHRYSWRNCELIVMQCPNASHVAGFDAWRHMDRHVVKGSKAIWILAPMIAKDRDTGDSTVRGFKAVPVFDISQTDGEPLPADPCALLAGSDGGIYPALVAFANALDYEVVDRTADELPPDANGLCQFECRRISIRVDREPAQRAKTLAHEIGHAILHDPKSRPDAMTRDLIELEAESVAFVVCAALGLVTDDYSFGYVATWVGADKVDAAIKAAASRIQKTADRILAGVAALAPVPA